MPSVSRVALISVHTCPLDQPGTGDAGGMNVYVRQVSRRLAEMGVSVDVFTRASGQRRRITTMDPGVRVIHLEAGPDRPVPKDDLHNHLEEFMYSLLRFGSEEAKRTGAAHAYDVVHAHYWLSGWVGRHVAERWGVPLLQSFHTLGKVKNLTLSGGDVPESPGRIAAERRVIETADCVLAPTTDEAEDLTALYGADPESVRVVAPGVDTDVFRAGGGPEAKRTAKRALGVEGTPVILFVGRLQVLKAPDVAVRALADLAPSTSEGEPVLVIVGGPSGNAEVQPESLEKMAVDLGVADRVRFLEPRPHGRLPEIYRAADVTLIPSRSESFGLVALESAACGTPVVASDIGGLRTTVRDGVTGTLVPHGSPAAFAAPLHELLTDRDKAARYSAAGARFARGFDWRRAAAGLITVYEEYAAARAV